MPAGLVLARVAAPRPCLYIAPMGTDTRAWTLAAALIAAAVCQVVHAQGTVPYRLTIVGPGTVATSLGDSPPRLKPHTVCAGMRARFAGCWLKAKAGLGRMRLMKYCCGGNRSRN